MKIFKRTIAVVLLLVIMIAAVPKSGSTADAAYEPPYSLVKVGINSPLRSTRPAVPYVNLSNSSGFNVGSYDQNRNFTQSAATDSSSVRVAAVGGTVTVTDSAGGVVASGTGKLTLLPKNDAATAYMLPDSSYGANYSYYGGFEFICSGSTMTVVNYVGIERYVMGVVPYEMPASWPVEALKAQALCARTYMASHFNTYPDQGFDVCNTTYSQVYHGAYTNAEYVSKITSAVQDTAGEYILYKGDLISAYFHAASGGATENSENVWSATLGYLKGIEDRYENTPGLYTFAGTYTPEEIYSKMRAKDSSFNLVDVKEISYTTTAMGNMYSVTFKDSIGNSKTYTKESCRTKVLGAFTKYTSQRFSITATNVSSIDDGEEILGDELQNPLPPEDGEQIITQPESEIATGAIDATVDGYTVTDAGEGLMTNSIELMAGKTYTINSRGYGHNIGMSQYGAYGMANAGFQYNQIIGYYYTGVNISPNATPFTDIAPSMWYYNAVEYVYNNGLFNGTSSDKFEPESSMTRGQLVTVLGRMAGVDSNEHNYKGTIKVNSLNLRSGPGTTYTIIGVLGKGDTVTIVAKSGSWYQVVFNGRTGYVHVDYVTAASGIFSDVPVGEYYVGYVQWAAQAGIVEGYNASTFGPNDFLTREQMCVIIYRFAQKTGKVLPEKVEAVTFKDNNQISSWAKDAVSVAQRSGIVQGIGDNMFSPGGRCIRAQVAQILKNYLEV